MAAPRVNFLLNNGQSATSTTVAGTVPGTAVVGDVVLVQFGNNSNTVTVSAAPAGWTLLAGPNDNTVGNSWLYGKELVSGDIGAAVSWTFSAATRSTGQAAVYSGVSWSARMVGTPATDTAATSSIVIPTIGSVPAGSIFHAGFARIRGVPATDVAPPAGYSQGASERATTAYGSGSDVFVEAAHQIAASAGSYGGETATAPATSRGTTYAVALPATPPPAGTATGTTTTSGVAAGKRAPKATAVGAVTTVGSAAGKRTTKATATGSVTTAGSAAGEAPAVGVAVGTATGTTTVIGAAVGRRTPVASATGSVTVVGAAVGTQPGELRDITLTIGQGRSRGFTAAGISRGLTATATGSRTLTAAGSSRGLTAAGTSRTLTAEPLE